MHVTQYWLKFRGGTTDLSENSIAQAPTNTTYWIDETTQTALGVDFDNYTLTQDTSASTATYLIQSEKDLAFLSWTIYNNKAYNNHKRGSYFYSGITFKQTKDLNLSDYYWQPIGINYTRTGTTKQRYFSGNYDGGGYTVSGVFTPAGSGNGYSYQGLFGYVEGMDSTQLATLQNIGVIDSFIQGEDNIGGVVGYAGSNATISNAYNTGAVSGTGDYVGGVVGEAFSDVTNCYNTGTVSGSNWVGGVVGYAYQDPTITNCYNTGSVEGTNGYVGGVVGNVDSNATVSNAYNTGSVSGSSFYVGGVVGYADYNTTVSNVYNTGIVSGFSSVGGVVGYANGTVSNVYNIGSVIGTGEYIGGVVGGTYRVTITNCYNTGSVSGTGDYTGNYVGGVAGRVSSSATVSNAYNTGIVSGFSTVGGVVGEANGTISNVYNTGIVSGSSYVGGVVGRVYSIATVTNTYYGGHCEASLGGCNGVINMDGQAEYLADLEVLAKNEEWYLDSSNWNSSYRWNFETVWTFEIKDAPSYISDFIYPYLQSLGMTKHESIYWTDEYVQTKLGIDFDNYSLTKDASASTTTYLIQSETDLAYLSWTIYNDNPFGGSSNKVTSGDLSYFYSNITFKQTQNLDLSDYYWQPIGIGCTRDGTSADRYFSGKYDGGGFTVSGVFTPEGIGDGFSRQGLFGTARSINSSNKVTINNVKVVNSFIRGYQFVGSVIGVAGSNTTITNCHSASSVTGVGYVGGVVGYSYDKAIITNCYYTGSVKGTGNTNIGGIVGELEASTIENCGVEGAMISGPSNVGIFVGSITNYSTAIQNCYAIVDEALSPYGINSGTFTNCLWIAGGVKYRYGTDFSAFAWPNADSCPVPKSLSWIGQFWTGDITAEIMASSEWTDWVA